MFILGNKEAAGTKSLIISLEKEFMINHEKVPTTTWLKKKKKKDSQI